MSTSNEPPDEPPNLIVVGGDEPRIDSRVLAAHMGLQHPHVFEQIKTYGSDLARHGLVRFQTEAVTVAGQRGTKHQKSALLNEDQCYLLLTFARNTDLVRELKSRLIAAFRRCRLERDLRVAEYLPSYHGLHERFDVLAANSSNSKFVHMNVNKLINATVGIGAGERDSVSLPTRSLLVVAQSLACQATEGCVDHHDGYVRAKERLEALRRVIAPSQPSSTLPPHGGRRKSVRKAA
jgi:phage regulator Rha-like protein